MLLNLALLGGMLLLVLGRHIGARDLKRDPARTRAAFGALEASVLALLGLVLAFTISGAGTRFDNRRRLIVEETNAIGTAYLPLDVLPGSAQPAVRDVCSGATWMRAWPPIAGYPTWRQRTGNWPWQPRYRTTSGSRPWPRFERATLRRTPP